MSVELEERVDRLEEVAAEVWKAIGKLVNLQSASHHEMRDFIEEMKRDRQEMNRKWGDLAKKMGTLVEDIVAPGLPDAIRSTFGLEVEDIMERRKRRKRGDKSRRREYDVIAVADGKVFVVEVKSSLDSKDVDSAKKALEEFFAFFPEFKGKELVGVVSSLSVDESVIYYATKHGILVLTMGGEYLRFENADRVKI